MHYISRTNAQPQIGACFLCDDCMVAWPIRAQDGIPMSRGVFNLVVFTTFFNVALRFNEPHCFVSHAVAFIASTPKLSRARALVTRYTSTPFTPANNRSSRLPSPGYVSVSDRSATNGLCSVSLALGLLP